MATRKRAELLPDSASIKVVVYTIDPPYAKGRPGYVAAQQPNSDEVQFIDDLWLAKAMSREEWNRWLNHYKTRTRKELNTHAAVAMLGIPEEK